MELTEKNIDLASDSHKKEFILTPMIDDSILSEPKINFEIGKEKEEQITRALFKDFGFIDGEQWGQPINIQSQVVKISNYEVTCSCAIDLEKNIFQARVFPIKLFKHINNLAEGSFVLIRLKEKVGSSRIDVIDGSNNVVDQNIFKAKNKWDVLRNKNFHTDLPPGQEL